MSHEGIRFISHEEARRAEQRDRALPSEAVTPSKISVDVTGGTGMTILWKDNHRSHWSFPFLRDACPCATCHEEREKTGRAPGEPKPAPQSAFPMYKEPVRPRKAEPIGRYAIKFHWNDGHESGIYAWDYLRRLDER
ncbi:gamma-butyrobetaine hydroxylase-like domain-containing protein [Terriglobus sp.]|uniref:gamma-butyrobetaine hydroxylase-like domain-containing protein n=1 Tax=Terriglobus sp. TaxID=1889013 RepID=UPI003B00A706